MTEKDIKLWQDMADLTMQKCKQHCHQLGSCCSAEYCEMAVQFAAEKGVTLKRTPGKLMLNDQGVCIVPPHFRPLCTVHQCKINSLGFDPQDPKWTKKYFTLREKLERTMQ